MARYNRIKLIKKINNITNKKESEKLKAVSEHKIPYLDIKQYSGIYCYSDIIISSM